MKKKNAPKKVVAISTIAVLALAGISTVSVLSLAKNTDSAAASGIQNAGLDTASAKAAVREDAAAAPVVFDVAGANTNDQAAYTYSTAAPASADANASDNYEILAVDQELTVVSSLVEKTPSPEDVPVIAAVQTVDKVEETALMAQEPEEKVVELAVMNTEPIFAAPIEEPAAADPVVEETVIVPVAVDPVVEEPVAVDPVVEEPVAVDPVVEEPVAADPVVEEPAAADPVVEEPAAVDPYANYATYDLEGANDNETVTDDQDYDYDYDLDYDYDQDYDYGYSIPDIEDYAETTEVAENDINSGSSPLATTATGIRQQLVDYAASRVGNTPYVWAGRSLETGTDCSGFVNLIYDKFGMYASSGSDDYQNVEGDWGTNISYSELQPGDVVVYRQGGHVGIYAGQDENGNDIVIHDSNPEEGVKISDMNYTTPTAYVRIINDGANVSYDDDDSYDDESYNNSYSDDDYYTDDVYYGYDDSSYDDDDEDDGDNGYGDNDDYDDYNYGNGWYDEYMY